jgi:hypothetical protein
MNPIPVLASGQRTRKMEPTRDDIIRILKNLRCTLSFEDASTEELVRHLETHRAWTKVPNKKRPVVQPG